jgi:hypothetical protein
MNKKLKSSTNKLVGTKFQVAQKAIGMTIHLSKRLPENVFRSGWRDFHLFDSDWIFEQGFLKIVITLLDLEGSQCAYLVDLDHSDLTSEPMLLIDRKTTIQDYEQQLLGRQLGDGWLYNTSRFCCTSDMHTWSIYLERSSEIAIIGFNATTSQEQFKSIFDLVKASKVSSIGASSTGYEFSRHLISSQWEAEIKNNYQS